MAKTRTVELIAKLRNNMGAGLRNISSGAAAAATAIVAMGAAAFAAAKKLSDYGAEIYDVASATGVSVEAVQSLGYAFSQTGGSMSSMSGAIRGLNTFMRTAATGSAEYINVLNQLGLEYDSLRAMTPEQAFLQITDAIGGLDTAMEKNIAATTVFGGRYAQQITGALDQTNGSMRNLTDAFNESGNAMSGDQIASLKAYSDAMTDLDFAMKKLMADALGPILPQLQDMADKGMAIARDVLPELIPMIEAALNAMADGLPFIIDKLSMAADGWEKLSDAIQNGVGGSEATELMGALTDAVKTGAITAEQATEEWERLTDQQRSTASTVEGMLNPFATLRNSVSDANDMFGIFGDQQIRVGEELNNTAVAAFAAAEGMQAVDGAAVVSTASAYAQANAMGMVALAYSNFLNAGADVDPETLPSAVIGNASTAAEKLEMTTKQVLDNMKEFIKPLIEAKDIIEKHSELEDTLRQQVLDRKISEAEADQARQDALDKASAKAESFTGNVIAAAMQGQDAWSAYWDNMRNQILKTVAMKGFMMLLNLVAPGAGSALGGALGFLGLAGGGTIPHSPSYAAAGGMTVPGSMYGDRTVVALEAGEKVLTQNQAADLGGGGNITTISVDYRPMFSSASASDVTRMIPLIKKAMQKGNL